MKYLSIIIMLAICSPAQAQLFGLGERTVERSVTYNQPVFGLGSVTRAKAVQQSLPVVVAEPVVAAPVVTRTVKRRRVLRRVPMTFVRTVMQKRCQLINGQPVCQSYPVQTTETRFVEVWVDTP